MMKSLRRRTGVAVLSCCLLAGVSQASAPEEAHAEKEKVTLVLLLSERLVELKGVAGGLKYATQLTGISSAFEREIGERIMATGQIELVPVQGTKKLFLEQRDLAGGKRKEFDISPVLDHLAAHDVDRLVVIEAYDPSASWVAGGLHFTSTQPSLSVLRWSRRDYLTAMLGTYTTTYNVAHEETPVKYERKVLSVKLDRSIWPNEDSQLDDAAGEALIDNLLPYAVPVAIDAMCKLGIIEFEETKKLDKRVLFKTKKVCVPTTVPID